jgi:hypothetical protein
VRILLVLEKDAHRNSYSYGERGFMIVSSALQYMFTASDTNEKIEGIPFLTFLWRILIPETFVLLVIEDLPWVSSEEAMDILVTSRTYGQVMHPDDDLNQDDGQKYGRALAMRRARKDKDIQVV